MNETTDRPLSPHLQIYSPQMTTVMSIAHRITGLALAAGLPMIVWMLVAAVRGAPAWDVFAGFSGSLIGKLMMFGWSAALFYHTCNGVRHLLWDLGLLFSIENAYKAGYAVIIATVILVALLWVAVL